MWYQFVLTTSRTGPHLGIAKDGWSMDQEVEVCIMTLSLTMRRAGLSMDHDNDNEKSGYKYGPWRICFAHPSQKFKKIVSWNPHPFYAGSNIGIYAYHRNKWPTSWYLDDGLQPQVVLALPTWGTRGTLVTGSLFLIGGLPRRTTFRLLPRGSWGSNATARMWTSAVHSLLSRRMAGGVSTDEFLNRSKRPRFTVDLGSWQSIPGSEPRALDDYCGR